MGMGYSCRHEIHRYVKRWFGYLALLYVGHTKFAVQKKCIGSLLLSSDKNKNLGVILKN